MLTSCLQKLRTKVDAFFNRHSKVISRFAEHSRSPFMQSVKSTPLVLSLTLALCAAVTTQGSHAASAESNPGTAANHTPLNVAQLAEMNQRVALAQTIVNNIAADAQAKGIGDTWQIRELSILYNTHSSILSNIANSATTVDQVHAQVIAAKFQTPAGSASIPVADNATPKFLGTDDADNLVFYPQTPCRYIDTRVVGGPISTSSPRVFLMDIGGANYGGDEGCNASNDPYLAANVTIIVAGGSAGYLTIRPQGSTQTTSFINWPAGGTPGLANAGIIANAPPSSGSSGHYQFEALAGVTTPQMIVDVFGTFAKAKFNTVQDTLAPGAAYLTCEYNVTDHRTVPPGITNVNVNCPDTQYTAVSAVCLTGDPTVALSGSGVDSINSGYCSWNNMGHSASSDVMSRVRCCQTPSVNVTIPTTD
jgi:hypothetical protein